MLLPRIDPNGGRGRQMESSLVGMGSISSAYEAVQPLPRLRLLRPVHDKAQGFVVSGEQEEEEGRRGRSMARIFRGGGGDVELDRAPSPRRNVLDAAEELQRLAAERIKEHRSRQRRRQRREQEQQQQEDFERQRRAQEAQPLVENFRKEVARRAAQKFHREREDRRLEEIAREDVLSARRERVKHYEHPATIDLIRAADPKEYGRGRAPAPSFPVVVDSSETVVEGSKDRVRNSHHRGQERNSRALELAPERAPKSGQRSSRELSPTDAEELKRESSNRGKRDGNAAGSDPPKNADNAPPRTPAEEASAASPTANVVEKVLDTVDSLVEASDDRLDTEGGEEPRVDASSTRDHPLGEAADAADESTREARVDEAACNDDAS